MKNITYEFIFNFRYLLFISLFLLSYPLKIKAQEVPYNIQAAIFIKVLNYDKNLTTRAGGGVSILVLTDGGTSGKSGELEAAFNTIAGKVIQGKKVTFRVVKFSDAGKLAADVNSSGANHLYIPMGSADGTVNAAFALSGSKKIPLLAGDQAIVEKGAAVGIALVGAKPKIVINLPESKKQGMNLSAQVLQLAKIIK